MGDLDPKEYAITLPETAIAFKKSCKSLERIDDDCEEACTICEKSLKHSIYRGIPVGGTYFICKGITREHEGHFYCTSCTIENAQEHDEDGWKDTDIIEPRSGDESCDDEIDTTTSVERASSNSKNTNQSEETSSHNNRQRSHSNHNRFRRRKQKSPSNPSDKSEADEAPSVNHRLLNRRINELKGLLESDDYSWLDLTKSRQTTLMNEINDLIAATGSGNITNVYPDYNRWLLENQREEKQRQIPTTRNSQQSKNSQHHTSPRSPSKHTSPRSPSQHTSHRDTRSKRHRPSHSHRNNKRKRDRSKSPDRSRSRDRSPHRKDKSNHNKSKHHKSSHHHNNNTGHRGQHRSRERATFKCAFCSKICFDKKEYKTHLRIHVHPKSSQHPSPHKHNSNRRKKTNITNTNNKSCETDSNWSCSCDDCSNSDTDDFDGFDSVELYITVLIALSDFRPCDAKFGVNCIRQKRF